MMKMSCYGKNHQSLEPPGGRFAPCPKTPNCVSSLSRDPQHAISPIMYLKQEHPFNDLVRTIEELPKVEFRIREENYLYVLVRSRIFSFIDDVEFFYDKKKGIVHMRSSSRTGYFDFGKNRKRLEYVRRSFLEKVSLN